MIIRMLLSVIAALTVTISGYYYIYQTIFLPLIGNKSPTFLIIYLLLCSLTFFGFLLIRILPHFLRKIVELIMFTWMGCSFIFFILCLITSPLQIYFAHTQNTHTHFSIYLFFIGIIVIVYSMFQALRKPSIVKTVISLPKTIPKEIDALTAVVLSDVHVSGLIGRRKMRQLVERVNALNPDFIFLTGDLMDGSLKQLHKEIDPLKNLRAKKEIIYITGNHEYYSGPIAWKEHFQNNFNWHILSNTAKIINANGVTLNILGIEDKHWLSYEKISRKQDQRLNASVEDLRQQRLHLETSQAAENCPPLENCLNILLAHQPKDAKNLKTHPWINLQISGHTHGGQIWPLKYLVIKDQKYNAGLYKVAHNQYIYVNQGTGFWGPPMRLGTRGEISLLSFKRMS